MRLFQIIIIGLLFAMMFAIAAVLSDEPKHRDMRPACLEKPEAFDVHKFSKTIETAAKRNGVKIETASFNPIKAFMIDYWMEADPSFSELAMSEWRLIGAVISPSGAFVFRGKSKSDRDDGLQPICFIYILDDKQSELIFGTTPSGFGQQNSQTEKDEKL